MASTRTKGVFNFSANFEALIAAPLDARLTVPNYSNLTDGATIPYPYLGMIVAVTSDATPSNNGIYYCTNIGTTPAFATATTVWQKIESGSGTDIYVTGATLNGTTLELQRNDNQTISVDLSSLGGGGTDKYVTGGTVDGNTLTLYYNDNTSFTIDVTSLASDSYVTGATVNGTTITLNLNNGKPDVDIDISSMLCDGITGLVATGTTITGVTTGVGGVVSVEKYSPFIYNIVTDGKDVYVDLYNAFRYYVEVVSPGETIFNPKLLSNVSVLGTTITFTYDGSVKNLDITQLDTYVPDQSFTTWLTTSNGNVKVAYGSPNLVWGSNFSINSLINVTSLSFISKNLLVSDWEGLYLEAVSEGGTPTSYFVKFPADFWETKLGLGTGTFDPNKFKFISEIGDNAGEFAGSVIDDTSKTIAVIYNNVYYVVIFNTGNLTTYSPILVTGGTNPTGTTIGQSLMSIIDQNYNIRLALPSTGVEVISTATETCYLRLEFANCDGTTQTTLIDLTPLNNCLTVTGGTGQDSYVTGATVNGTTITLNLNNGKPDVTFTITGITTTDTYVTGGTTSAGTGGTVNIDLVLETNQEGNGNVNIDLSQAFTFLNNNPVKQTVGGVANGSTPFNGDGLTLHEIIQKIFYPDIAPTRTYSSASLTENFGASVNPSLLEIAAVDTVTLNAAFVRGTSVVAGQITKLMGLPSSYVYSGPSITGTHTNTTTALTNTHTLSGYTVTQGVQTWTAVVNYSVGEQPVFDTGAPFTDTAFTNAGSRTVTTSFEGVYPIFAATATTTVLTKQSLVSMISGNNLEYTLVAEVNPGEHTFAIPDAWLAGRPLTSVQYFNTVSNQYDTTNQITDWVTTPITQTIQGQTVNYTKYTKKVGLPTTGSRKIKLIF